MITETAAHSTCCTSSLFPGAREWQRTLPISRESKITPRHRSASVKKVVVYVKRKHIGCVFIHLRRLCDDVLYKWRHLLYFFYFIFSKIPDISLTAVNLPDISRFSRQVVTLSVTWRTVQLASLWQLSFLLSITQKMLLLTLPVSSVFSACSLAVCADRLWMQWRWCDSRPLEAATSDTMSTLVVCTSVRCRLSLQHTCNGCMQNGVSSYVA